MKLGLTTPLLINTNLPKTPERLLLTLYWPEFNILTNYKKGCENEYLSGDGHRLPSPSPKNTIVFIRKKLHLFISVCHNGIIIIQ